MTDNKKLYKVANMYKLKSLAQEKAVSAMGKYTAMLRALAIIHQHAHWTSKHDTYYGDHLLFDRLYNGVSDHVDKAAEKSIGLFGIQSLDLKTHIDTIESFVNDSMKKGDEDSENGLAERSLAAEESFLDFSKKLYDSLKSSNKMTLGLDDLIMSIASEHETFVYLLKQRLAD